MRGASGLAPGAAPHGRAPGAGAPHDTGAPSAPFLAPLRRAGGARRGGALNPCRGANRGGHGHSRESLLDGPLRSTRGRALPNACARRRLDGRRRRAGRRLHGSPSCDGSSRRPPRRPAEAPAGPSCGDFGIAHRPPRAELIAQRRIEHIRELLEPALQPHKQIAP